MTIRRSITVAVVSVGIAATAVAVPVATAAPTDPTTDILGGWNRLIDDGGNVITVWQVSGLKPSSDTIPGYPLAGKLWEATAAVRAAKGTVTPIIPDFSARAANGTSYPVLWQAATPPVSAPPRCRRAESQPASCTST